MLLLVYSDVHGNLPAFETMLKDAGKVDGNICLGDLVNYGPWSNECVDLATSLPNSVIIKGNHEEAFLNNHYPGTNELVKKFFSICSRTFNRTDEIKNFVPGYKAGNFNFSHTIEDRTVYEDSVISLDENKIIGHSHHQFSIESNGYTLFNTGSVGQNRRFINVASYLLYDVADNKIHLRSTKYNLDIVINEMKLRNYPKECIDYYVNKDKA